MWFSKYFRKTPKPAPAIITVGLDDHLKQQIEKIIDSIIWSGDTTFNSRNDILELISMVIEKMRTDRIIFDTTSDDIRIYSPNDSDYQVVETQEIDKIETPEKVVRTKLKPLTFTKISDDE